MDIQGENLPRRHGDTEETSELSEKLQFARREGVGGVVLLRLFERDRASSSFWPHSPWRCNKRKRFLGRVGRGFRTKKLPHKPPGEAESCKNGQDFEKGGHDKLLSVSLCLRGEKPLFKQ
jgi:hypothetical protein